MEETHSPRSSHVAWTTFFTFLALFGTRLPPALAALSGELRLVDEVELTLTTLDRLLGLPTTSLAWPATFVQLVTLPFQLLLHVAAALPNGWNDIALEFGETYRAPATAVFLQRVVTLTLFSAAASAWVPVLVRRGASPLTAALAVFVGALQPLVWFHSFIGTGEGLGMALVLEAFRAAVDGRRNGEMWAGILMGFALASRLTLLPCVVLLACWVRDGRALVRLSAAVTLGFVFACPSAWMEPVRLLKSIVGNSMRPGGASATNPAALLLSGAPPASWAFLLIYSGWRLRQGWPKGGDVLGRFVLVVLAVTIALALLPVAGRQVEARYLLSLPIAIWLLLLLGLEAVSHDVASRVRNYRFGLGAAYCALIVVQVRDVEAWCRTESRYVEATRGLSVHLDDSHQWLIDERLLGAALPCIPSERLDEIRVVLQRSYAQAQAKGSWIVARGIPEAWSKLLAANFTEDEQASLGRLRAAAISPPLWPCRVTPFSTGAGPHLPFERALEMMGDGRADRLVVLDEAVEGMPIVASFGSTAKGLAIVHPAAAARPVP